MENLRKLPLSSGTFPGQEPELAPGHNINTHADKTYATKIGILTEDRALFGAVKYSVQDMNFNVGMFPVNANGFAKIYSYYPDIIIIDTDNPMLEKLRLFMKNLQQMEEYIPVILVGKNKFRINFLWKEGPYDFVYYDLIGDEILMHIKRAERIRFMLETNVTENMLDFLVRISEAKGYITLKHINNVVRLSIEIAKNIKTVSDEYINELALAARYHDIGKIAIPDKILLSPNKLSKRDYEIIKRHTTVGYHIVKNFTSLGENIASMIRHHHEWWNGMGYPDGLKGVDIPIGARIISVADAFDTMTSDRIYRKRIQADKAIEELIRMSGTQFDPDVVKVFTMVYFSMVE